MQESTGSRATRKTVNARTRRKRLDCFIHSQTFLCEVAQWPWQAQADDRLRRPSIGCRRRWTMPSSWRSTSLRQACEGGSMPDSGRLSAVGYNNHPRPRALVHRRCVRSPRAGSEQPTKLPGNNLFTASQQIVLYLYQDQSPCHWSDPLRRYPARWRNGHGSMLHRADAFPRPDARRWLFHTPPWLPRSCPIRCTTRRHRRHGTSRRLTATIQFSRVANEWQQNQWILQPLGFVDGNDFNQVGIAFQTQYFFFTGRLQLLGQVTNQCIFAVQLSGAALQPFG